MADPPPPPPPTEALPNPSPSPLQPPPVPPRTTSNTNTTHNQIRPRHSSTSTTDANTLSPLKAQADRLKLISDPLSRTRRASSSAAKTPYTSTTSTPLSQTSTSSPQTSTIQFPNFDPEPFAEFEHYDKNFDPFSPPIDSSALDLYITTGDMAGDASSRRSSASVGMGQGQQQQQQQQQQQHRKMSKEWDASKVPPSRFQKAERSIFATQGSRDGHVDRNVQHRFVEKEKVVREVKEKKWAGLVKRRGT